jgi:plasmid stabilization system protein ParE
VKKCVFIRAAAETDLRKAGNWYERQREGLGDAFLASIAEVLAEIEETPERFPVYYREFRRALADRFPYKVFFRIEGDIIVVFRILHAARDHTRKLK